MKNKATPQETQKTLKQLQYTTPGVGKTQIDINQPKQTTEHLKTKEKHYTKTEPPNILQVAFYELINETKRLFRTTAKTIAQIPATLAAIMGVTGSILLAAPTLFATPQTTLYAGIALISGATTILTTKFIAIYNLINEFRKNFSSAEKAYAYLTGTPTQQKNNEKATTTIEKILLLFALAITPFALKYAGLEFFGGLVLFFYLSYVVIAFHAYILDPIFDSIFNKKERGLMDASLLAMPFTALKNLLKKTADTLKSTQNYFRKEGGSISPEMSLTITLFLIITAGVLLFRVVTVRIPTFYSYIGIFLFIFCPLFAAGLWHYKKKGNENAVKILLMTFCVALFALNPLYGLVGTILIWTNYAKAKEHEHHHGHGGHGHDAHGGHHHGHGEHGHSAHEEHHNTNKEHSHNKHEEHNHTSHKKHRLNDEALFHIHKLPYLGIITGMLLSLSTYLSGFPAGYETGLSIAITSAMLSAGIKRGLKAATAVGALGLTLVAAFFYQITPLLTHSKLPTEITGIITAIYYTLIVPATMYAAAHLTPNKGGLQKIDRESGVMDTRILFAPSTALKQLFENTKNSLSTTIEKAVYCVKTFHPAPTTTPNIHKKEDLIYDRRNPKILPNEKNNEKNPKKNKYFSGLRVLPSSENQSKTNFWAELRQALSRQPYIPQTTALIPQIIEESTGPDTIHVVKHSTANTQNTPTPSTDKKSFVGQTPKNILSNLEKKSQPTAVAKELRDNSSMLFEKLLHFGEYRGPVYVKDIGYLGVFPHKKIKSENISKEISEEVRKAEESITQDIKTNTINGIPWDEYDNLHRNKGLKILGRLADIKADIKFRDLQISSLTANTEDSRKLTEYFNKVVASEEVRKQKITIRLEDGWPYAGFNPKKNTGIIHVGEYLLTEEGIREIEAAMQEESVGWTMTPERKKNIEARLKEYYVLHELFELDGLISTHLEGRQYTEKTPEGMIELFESHLNTSKEDGGFNEYPPIKKALEILSAHTAVSLTELFDLIHAQNVSGVPPISIKYASHLKHGLELDERIKKIDGNEDTKSATTKMIKKKTILPEEFFEPISTEKIREIKKQFEDLVKSRGEITLRANRILFPQSSALILVKAVATIQDKNDPRYSEAYNTLSRMFNVVDYPGVAGENSLIQETIDLFETYYPGVGKKSIKLTDKKMENSELIRKTIKEVNLSIFGVGKPNIPGITSPSLFGKIRENLHTIFSEKQRNLRDDEIEFLSSYGAEIVARVNELMSPQMWGINKPQRENKYRGNVWLALEDAVKEKEDHIPAELKTLFKTRKEEIFSVYATVALGRDPKKSFLLLGSLDDAPNALTATNLKITDLWSKDEKLLCSDGDATLTYEYLNTNKDAVRVYAYAGREAVFEADYYRDKEQWLIGSLNLIYGEETGELEKQKIINLLNKTIENKSDFFETLRKTIPQKIEAIKESKENQDENTEALFLPKGIEGVTDKLKSFFAGKGEFDLGRKLLLFDLGFRNLSPDEMVLAYSLLTGDDLKIGRRIRSDFTYNLGLYNNVKNSVNQVFNLFGLDGFILAEKAHGKPLYPLFADTENASNAVLLLNWVGLQEFNRFTSLLRGEGSSLEKCANLISKRGIVTEGLAIALKLFGAEMIAEKIETDLPSIRKLTGELYFTTQLTGENLKKYLEVAEKARRLGLGTEQLFNEIKEGRNNKKVWGELKEKTEKESTENRRLPEKQTSKVDAKPPETPTEFNAVSKEVEDTLDTSSTIVKTVGDILSEKGLLRYVLPRNSLEGSRVDEIDSYLTYAVSEYLINSGISEKLTDEISNSRLLIFIKERIDAVSFTYVEKRFNEWINQGFNIKEIAEKISDETKKKRTPLEEAKKKIKEKIAQKNAVEKTISPVRLSNLLTQNTRNLNTVLKTNIRKISGDLMKVFTLQTHNSIYFSNFIQQKKIKSVEEDPVSAWIRKHIENIDLRMQNEFTDEAWNNFYAEKQLEALDMLKELVKAIKADNIPDIYQDADMSDELYEKKYRERFEHVVLPEYAKRTNTRLEEMEKYRTLKIKVYSQKNPNTIHLNGESDRGNLGVIYRSNAKMSPRDRKYLINHGFTEKDCNLIEALYRWYQGDHELVALIDRKSANDLSSKPQTQVISLLRRLTEGLSVNIATSLMDKGLHLRSRFDLRLLIFAQTYAGFDPISKEYYLQSEEHKAMEKEMKENPSLGRLHYYLPRMDAIEYSISEEYLRPFTAEELNSFEAYVRKSEEKLEGKTRAEKILEYNELMILQALISYKTAGKTEEEIKYTEKIFDLLIRIRNLFDDGYYGQNSLLHRTVEIADGVCEG